MEEMDRNEIDVRKAIVKEMGWALCSKNEKITKKTAKMLCGPRPRGKTNFNSSLELSSKKITIHN